MHENKKTPKPRNLSTITLCEQPQPGSEKPLPVKVLLQHTLSSPPGGTWVGDTSAPWGLVGRDACTHPPAKPTGQGAQCLLAPRGRPGGAASSHHLISPRLLGCSHSRGEDGFWLPADGVD